MGKQFLYFIILVTFFSCKQKKKEQLPEIEVLPYVEVIKTELKELEQTPLAIYKYTIDTLGQIVDSVILERKDFVKITNDFLEPNIALPEYRKYYTEMNFNDLTSNQYNFSYDTKEPKMAIKNLIISTTKEEQSKFVSVQINKNYKKEKSDIQEKLFWKMNSYCTLTTFENTNGIEKVTMQKIVWNLR